MGLWKRIEPLDFSGWHRPHYQREWEGVFIKLVLSLRFGLWGLVLLILCQLSGGTFFGRKTTWIWHPGGNGVCKSGFFPAGNGVWM